MNLQKQNSYYVSLEGKNLKVLLKEKGKVKDFLFNFYTKIEEMTDQILGFSAKCHSTQNEILSELQRSHHFKDCIGDFIYFYLSFLNEYSKDFKELGKSLTKMTSEKESNFEFLSETVNFLEKSLLNSSRMYDEYNAVWVTQSKKYENYCNQAEKKIELYKRNSSKAIRIFNEVERTSEFENLKSLIQKVLEKEVILLELSEEFYKKKVILCEDLSSYLQALEKLRESIETFISSTIESIHLSIIEFAHRLYELYEEKMLHLENLDQRVSEEEEKDMHLPNEKSDIMVYTEWLEAKYLKIEEKCSAKILLLRSICSSINNIKAFLEKMKDKCGNEDSSISSSYINASNVFYLRFQYLSSSLEHFVAGLERRYSSFSSSTKELFNENKSMKIAILNFLGQKTEFSSKSLRDSIESTNSKFIKGVNFMKEEEIRISGMMRNFFKEFLFGACNTLKSLSTEECIINKPPLYTFTFPISRTTLQVEKEKGVPIKFSKLLEVQDLKFGDENLLESIANQRVIDKSPRKNVELEEDEVRLGVFNCALSDSILLHGKLEITNKSLLFYSRFNRKNLFFGETMLYIPRVDIISVQKRKYGFLLNSIEINTKKGNILFTSFISSNKAYDLLSKRKDELEEEYSEVSLELVEEEISISDELKELLSKRKRRIMEENLPSDSDVDWTFVFPKEVSLLDVFRTLFSGKEYFANNRKFNNFINYFKEKAYSDFAFVRTPFEPDFPDFFTNGDNPEQLADFPDFSECVEESRHPVVQKMPFLPKECGIEEKIKIFWCSHDCFIHHSETSTNGIPYADTFKNLIIYTVRVNEEGFVQVEFKLKFVSVKNTMMKNTIMKQTISDINDSSFIMKELLREFSKNLILSKNKNNKKSFHEGEKINSLNSEPAQDSEIVKMLESRIQLLTTRIQRSNFIIIILLVLIIFLIFEKIYAF